MKLTLDIAQWNADITETQHRRETGVAISWYNRKRHYASRCIDGFFFFNFSPSRYHSLSIYYRSRNTRSCIHYDSRVIYPRLYGEFHANLSRLESCRVYSRPVGCGMKMRLFQAVCTVSERLYY